MRPQRTKPATVDAYIGRFPPDVRASLGAIRRTVREAAPDAEETISYQIPTYKLDGSNFLHFAAHAKHIGMYPRPSGSAAFEKALAPYAAAEATLRFPIAEAIPHGLVKKIVVHRVREHRASKKR